MRIRRYFNRRTGLDVFIAFIINFSFLGLANTSSGNLDQNPSQLSSTVANQLDQQGVSYISGTPIFYNSSVTGNLHVFFPYYMFIAHSDTLLYHIYELENGSWSLPKLAFGYDEFSSLGVLEGRDHLYIRIMAIRPSEQGFILYIYYESPHKVGLSAIEYDENSEKWLDQKEIFGVDYMEDYLKLATPIIGLTIHSLFLEENTTFYIVWGYLDQSDYYSYHRYIITKVDQVGGCESQDITGKTFYNGFPMAFYKHNNTLTLFDSYLRYRTILFSNGSWSNWENATLASEHGSFPNWSPNPWSDNNFIEEQYFFSQDNLNGQEIFLLYDLAQGNQLQQKSLSLPYSPYYTDDNKYPNLGFELNVSTSTELIFALGLMTNETLELWQYHSTNNKWKQISILEINESLIMQRCSAHYSLDVIKDESNWRIFWRGSCDARGNLYTTTYDAESNNWGPVTCIMNASTIYTDYYDYFQNTTPALEFLIIMFSLVSLVVIVRKTRKSVYYLYYPYFT